MSKIKDTYADEAAFHEAVEEPLRGLFTKQSDGGFLLTGIDLPKGDEGGVARVQSALDLEKKRHKETRDKLALFGQLDPEEVHAKLDEFDILKQAADPEAIKKASELSDAQLRAAKAPIERERDAAIRERDELRAEREQMIARDRSNKVDSLAMAWAGEHTNESVRKDVIRAARALATFDDDGALITAEYDGIPRGLTLEDGLAKMLEASPHWGLESKGGGSTTTRTNSVTAKANPWKKETSDLQARIDMVAENPEQAKSFAKQAGYDKPVLSLPGED